MEPVPFLVSIVFWLIFVFVLTHKDDVMDFRYSQLPLRILGKEIPDSPLHQRIDYAFALLFSLFGAAWFMISAFYPEFVQQVDDFFPGNPTPR